MSLASLFIRPRRGLCFGKFRFRRARALPAPGPSDLAPAPVPAPVLSSLSAGASLAHIEAVEAQLLTLPQIEVPVTHRFAPGVYLRSVTMPAGSRIIGHEHTTEHFNIVLSGRARVLLSDGRCEEIAAPAVFTSGAGVRKVLEIIEDMTWMTVHPTTETDIETLDAILVRKSTAWLRQAVPGPAPSLVNQSKESS